MGAEPAPAPAALPAAPRGVVPHRSGMRADPHAHPPALVAGLLDTLAVPLARRRGRALLVGLSGLQGSGKSTLARQLAAAAHTRAIACCLLALDDFYLGRRARAALARTIHPLLATRGVPGTHDTALLAHTLAALAHASERAPVRVPRFDKGRDTRLPPSCWARVRRPPQLILLEGWCVGVPPQASSALRQPLNALERDCDPQAVWRRYVNARLASDYTALWQCLDRLVLLQAPDFACARRWRAQAEQALRQQGAPRAMAPRELERFMQHYERLSRHALATLPARADLCVQLDHARRTTRIPAGP